MTYQIQQLPAATQKALSIGSCLGHRMTFSTLQTATAYSQEDVYEALQSAFNSGILIQSDSEVHFAHDRVQEAAYRLLAEAEKASTHLIVGQRLLASPSGEEILLFDILAQFNRCHTLVTEPREQLQMASLNLKAAQKAKQATAYAIALNYLYEGQKWIDIKALWQIDYSLAVTFHKELAEVEYLSGHVDTSQNILLEILPRLQSTLDKVEIYHLLVIQKIVQGQQQDAIAYGDMALQLLGSGLPLENPTDYIQREMPLLKQRLANISFSSLLDAPLVADTEKQAIFRILADLSSACYQIGSPLLPAVTVMSINLSLIHGHAPESCLGYVVYGLLLGTHYQEYALGYEFGALAMQLARKLQSPVQYCRSALFMYDFIYGWSKSIQDLPAKFTSLFEECLACGEIEYAGYCGDARVHMSFDGGAHLTTVKQYIEGNLEFAKSKETKGVIYSVMRGYQRVVVNLLGETENENDFHVSGTEFEPEYEKSASDMALCLYNIRKAEALYIYGHFAQALQCLNSARSRLACILGFYATAVFNWYDSLTRLALYPTASSEEQQAYLQQVAQNQQQMQKWQASCPENFAHKDALIKALLAWINADYTQAEALFNRAIELAGRYGFIKERALIAEQAIKYWQQKSPLCAQGYMNVLFNDCKQWGAKRKLILLKRQYPDLLQALPPSLSRFTVNEETTFSGSALQKLDLSSILKASHTISREIELPKLLRNMMEIIIENAGGQQGAVLFIEPDDTVFVQAEYAADGTITTLQKIPLAQWANGAHAVVHYVKRLHQPVVIDNATTHEQFKIDPHISQKQVKSILCVPLLKHADLKAILYVENNLMSHAFTPERVQTVLILTAQMTISLENARYFAEQIELTRRLAEQFARTQMAEESLHAVTHDFKLALDASKAGTWNLWIDSKKVTWDETCGALFGFRPNEFNGTYEETVERIHPEDREQVNEAIKNCIEQNIPYNTEFRVIWPDGSQHVISGHGRVYRDQKGQPLKMAGVSLDITQRRQLERERQEALQKAERARIREDQIAKLSHEIRNPLQGLISSVEQLDSGMKTLSTDMAIVYQGMPELKTQLTAHVEEYKNTLEDMEECSEHLKDLLNDVLDLAKLEANKMELDIKIIQPKGIIQSVAKMFAARFTEKKLQLNLQLPQDNPWVKGDAQRLKQVLINLIANALKFTEEGSITLGLQILQTTTTNSRLQFTVADTGIGMTPEEKGRLFQRFSQASAGIASQYGGSGLGLELSDKLVKLMNGQIEVTSEKGKGTQFNFVIECPMPTPEELKTIAKQPEEVKPPAILPTVVPQARNILIADDNATNRKILANLLKSLGYAAQTANNGQEAIHRFEESAFDLIFMDIEMPIMDGLEATKFIRNIEQSCNLSPTPIIGLSGHTERENRERGLQAGMNDYLTKPYKKEEILAIVTKYMRTQQIPITFVYQQSQARSIHLAGSFNRWLNAVNGKITGDCSAWAMHKDEEGLWRLTVPLAPGTYAFKYAINDGERWENDPHYPLSSDSYRNSLLTVKAPSPVELLLNNISQNRSYYEKTFKEQQALLTELNCLGLSDHQILTNSQALTPTSERYEQKQALYEKTLHLLKLQQTFYHLQEQLSAQLGKSEITAEPVTKERQARFGDKKVFFDEIPITGNGWCTLRAVTVDEPTVAIKTLIENLNNSSIVNCVRRAMENNYYASLTLNEPFTITGKDERGNEISEKIKQLYSACQTNDPLEQQQAYATFIGYLENFSVQKAYLESILETKYADPNLAEACLILQNKKLIVLIDYGLPHGQLVNYSSENLNPYDLDTICIVYYPGTSTLTAHYNRLVPKQQEQSMSQEKAAITTQGFEQFGFLRAPRTILPDTQKNIETDIQIHPNRS